MVDGGKCFLDWRPVTSSVSQMFLMFFKTAMLGPLQVVIYINYENVNTNFADVMKIVSCSYPN